MNIAKERDKDLKQKRAHNVLPAYPLFDSDLPAQRAETAVNCPSTPVF